MESKCTVGDIISAMKQWYPEGRAHSWDRVGLVTGHPDRPVCRILLALDPTIAVVQAAADGGYDMLITHHPLLLRGASFLPETDPKGRIVATLIRAGVSLYCAHTNADVSHDGVAHALADLCGLRGQRVLSVEGVDEQGASFGLGRIGEVEAITLRDYAERLASLLPAGPQGIYVGGDLDAEVRTVAVSGGAGDSFLGVAREAGADVFVTADLRHHPASEHLDGGAPALICTSHWASEVLWLPLLARKLEAEAQRLGEELVIDISPIVTEPWSLHLPTTGELQ